jgi:beta-glucosidase
VEFGVDHSEEEDENGEPLQNKTVAAYKLKSYDDPEWDYLIEQITFDEAWMMSPYGGTSNEPFKSVNAPEVWQIDGPNGNVSRWIGKNSAVNGPMALDKNDPNYGYMSSDMPIEPVIAATFNKELLFEEGKIFGEDGLWSRNTFQWAPGMNLHRTPFNARNHEYYSEDPMLTAICGSQVVHGGLTKGMVLAAKHFAFNTQESFREGLCQFMEEQSARELELRAYEMLCDIKYVNSAGNEISALGLMSSFSRVGVYGVNSHTGVMKNILRGEWGYKGIISTDMVVGGNFFNPQDSIFNNVTFMATSNPENLLNSYWPDYNDKNKVKSDPVLMQAIYDNLHHYMYTIANSNVLNGISAEMSFAEAGKETWEYMLIGGAVLFGLLTVGGLAMMFIPVGDMPIGYQPKVRKSKAGEEPEPVSDDEPSNLDSTEIKTETITNEAPVVDGQNENQVTEGKEDDDDFEEI